MKLTIFIGLILMLVMCFFEVASGEESQAVFFPIVVGSQAEPPQQFEVNPVGTWQGSGGHRLMDVPAGTPSGYEKYAKAIVVIEELSGSNNEGYTLTIQLWPSGVSVYFIRTANGILLDNHIIGMPYNYSLQEPFEIIFISDTTAILKYVDYDTTNLDKTLYIIKLTKDS